MSELNIQHYGDGLELYLARITRDQWLRFERACARWFGIYRKATLHRKWYSTDRDFRRVFGVHDWRQLYSGDHRYYGPLLNARTEIDAFCEFTTLFLDGEEIRMDPRRMKMRFLKAPAIPKPGEEHVVVCHGEGYKGYTQYTGCIEEPFDSGKLGFDFLPCGDNGYVLETLRYGDGVLQMSDDPDNRDILQIQVVAG
ncbi:MAG: hypothetical protein P8010_02045 [Desulfosarcinaceae bacterium]|jgi:hypothetical protein